MEQIWWKQITKAKHFIDMVTDAILDNKSVILSMPAFVPWHETMYEMIAEILNGENSLNRLISIDCPTGDVGQYLLDNYCKKEKRASYRYGMSYASFLAKSEDIVLYSSYIWVNAVSGQKLEEWSRFIAEYNKNVPSHMSPAVFILEIQDSARKPKAVRGVRHISFSDTIDAYDKFTFCALASTDIAIRSSLRPYLAEMVSTICSDDIELCAQCIRRGQAFLRNPADVLSSIIDKECHSDFSPFVMDLDKSRIDSLIWECQIKLIFPVIEKYRSRFVSQHQKEISAALPIDNAFGDVITSPQDVELGHLVQLVGMGRISLTLRGYQELDLFRKARNDLAHLTPLEYEAVEDILG